MPKPYLDPNNKAWSTQKSGFGYKTMQKMGWVDGQGLGSNASGMSTHIRVQRKDDKKGIGASISSDAWLAPASAFDDILARLNASHTSGTETEFTPEEKVKLTEQEKMEEKKAQAKKVFYKRFVAAKTVSNYNDKDMNAIFGRPEDHVPGAAEKDQKASEKRIEESTGIVTTTSKMSMEDYFNQRMAARSAPSSPKEDKPSDDSSSESRKRKREDEADTGDSSDNDRPAFKRARADSPAPAPAAATDAEVERAARKEKKRKRKQREAEEAAAAAAEADAPVEAEAVVEASEGKKKKKKKKSKAKDSEDAVEAAAETEPVVEVAEESKKRKKSKSKKAEE